MQAMYSVNKRLRSARAPEKSSRLAIREDLSFRRFLSKDPMGSLSRHTRRSWSSAVSLALLYRWQRAASAIHLANSSELRSLGDRCAQTAINGTTRAPDQRMSMFTRPSSLLMRLIACSVAFLVVRQALSTSPRSSSWSGVRFLLSGLATNAHARNKCITLSRLKPCCRTPCKNGTTSSATNPEWRAATFALSISSVFKRTPKVLIRVNASTAAAKS